jgi:predicted nucleic acid-binding protein
MTPTVLDTNVISELVRLAPEPKVVTFLQSVDEPLVSSIVFHELAYGSERLRDADKRLKLDLFIHGVKTMYEGRIVEVELELAELGGRLRARASRSGWALSQFDSIIAATAILRRARLATRNTVDFERLDIPLVDPWNA